MKKTIIKFLKIFIIVTMVIVMGVITLFAMIFSGGKTPPPPYITEAEFPIKIEYELDGELKILEDVIVCEFGGYKSLGEAGKYRIWDSHLKSGNERLTLLKISENEQVYYEYDEPEYYMNDLRAQTIEQYGAHPAEIYYARIEENGTFTDYQRLSDEELIYKYNIKIVSIERTKPLGYGQEISKKDITNNLLEQIPLDKIQEENLATDKEK